MSGHKYFLSLERIEKEFKLKVHFKVNRQIEINMRIGELAKKSAIAAHTIRFYESKGLLPNTHRGDNGYRQYDQQSVERLALIQLCQRLGFSLADIEQLMQSDGDWDKVQIIDNLDARLAEIHQLQQGLARQRDEILTIKEQLQDRWKDGGCVTGPELQCLSRHLNSTLETDGAQQ